MQAHLPSNRRKYEDLLIQHKLPLSVHPWYIKHVLKFSEAFPGRSIKTITENEISAYLTDAGRLPDLKPWQFQQMVDAIRILLKDLLVSPAGLAGKDKAPGIEPRHNSA